MASLQNKQIDQTYAGLIKTNDEAALGATEKVIQDGAGNNSTLSMGTASASFTGTLDLSGATVTGFESGVQTVVAGTNITVDNTDPANPVVNAAGGGGAAGLESGSGADSMQSAASLTTVGANASGASAIALGDSATAPNEGDVNIGDGNTIAAKASLPGDVVIGQGNLSTTVNGGNNILIGKGNEITQNEQNIAIGRNNTISRGNHTVLGSGNTTSSQYKQLVLGNDNTSTVEEGLVIGFDNTYTNKWVTCIGRDNSGGNRENVTVGSRINNGSYRGIGIGYDADTGTGFGNVNVGIESGTDQGTGSFKIAMGYRSSSEAEGAIALGREVTASHIDTLSVRALETQTPSTPTAGGIIMTDAGSTERRLNITAGGDLQVDGNTVTKAFSTDKVSETQATSSCDTIRASVLIPANTFTAGDILEVRSLESISGTTGWTYPELWISTVGTVGNAPSGVNVAQGHTSSDGKAYYQKTIFVNSASGTNNIEHWPGAQANESFDQGQVTGGDPVAAQTVDWTVDQYLAVKVCIDNSGATWTNYGAVIRKIN